MRFERFHHGALAIAAAALVTAAPCALAQPPPGSASRPSTDSTTSQRPVDLPDMAEVQETCAKWSELAGRVMDLRQQGMPEVEAMDHTLGNAFFEALVVDAYDVRQLAQPAPGGAATLQFKNRWYLNCLRGGVVANQH